MDITKALEGAIGREQVLTGEDTLDAHRHDTWFLSQLDDHQGRGAPRPRCVARPGSVDDVVRIVEVCRDAGATIVPFGLGSGVCGGVLAAPEVVLVDLGGMTRCRLLDERDLVATFEAGTRGSDAEAQVRQAGLTLGHYPQSIGVSTVGGWVATRASGQFSTGYGNIEDVVLDLEAVLPNGEVLRTARTPRASSGPDLRHLLLGSEGTLGIVTAVTFSLRRAAERQIAAAFHVGGMEQGLELQREVVQRGWQPVVMRQYDTVEAQRMFSKWARGDDALLLVVHEGPAAKAEAEAAGVAATAAELGADPAGEEATRHWLAERNHVPTFQSFIDNGVVVDTIEIAATWSRIGGIYRAAIASLGEVPGLLAASAHSSHVYRSGVNLYFTFVAAPKDRADMRATYLECWRRVLRATADGGGGVSHHHGIGRVRRDWLERDVGPAGVHALRAVRGALDPQGMMNPGVLLPGGE
jgi:alkyldihydroxyacetonephosphate synthase